MPRSLLPLLLLLTVLCVPVAAQERAPLPPEPFAQPEEEKQWIEAASSAALAWLELVDRGAYEESWAATSRLFRLAVEQEAWVRALRASREPMGGLQSRTRHSAQYTQIMPGAPDGEYVVLQFASRFDRKQVGAETVTVQREDDGLWRVGGYFIR